MEIVLLIELDKTDIHVMQCKEYDYLVFFFVDFRQLFIFFLFFRIFMYQEGNGTCFVTQLNE